MRKHRNPRQRLPKRSSPNNLARSRRPSKRDRLAGPLNIILDVLRTVDRRRALRLVEALTALVTLATRKP